MDRTESIGAGTPLDDRPLVRAELIQGLEGPRYVVRECPYCGRPHIHGAEDGPRRAHCIGSAEYDLVGPPPPHDDA